MTQTLVRRRATITSTTTSGKKAERAKPALIKKKSRSLRFLLNVDREEQRPTRLQEDSESSAFSEKERNGLDQSPFAQVSVHNAPALLDTLEKQDAKLLKDYEAEITRHLKEVEHTTDNCLASHEITPEKRAQMVDWMIQNLSSLESLDQTTFLAVSLMDRYFKAKKETIPVSQSHLIEAACIFTASKFSDIYTLQMETLWEEIIHKKLHPDDILAQELDILQALSFNIGAPTSFEFLEIYLAKVFPKNKVSPSTVEFLQKMGAYLTKMCLYDYSISEIKPSLIAAGSIFTAFKIQGMLNGSQTSDTAYLRLLSNASFFSETQITEMGERIFELFGSFSIQYPGLDTLKRLYFGRYIEEEQEE